MLEKLYAHGLNWQLGIFMLLSFFIMKIKTVGNPFKSINTLYHECGHAIAALITNGEIYHIKLNSNTSGEALTSNYLNLVSYRSIYFLSLNTISSQDRSQVKIFLF
jgi:hypothetical protein